MFTVIAQQFGRHGLGFPAVEQVQKESFNNVVTVVTQRDLGHPMLFRKVVKCAPAQSRTQSAGRFALWNHAFYDAIGVLLDDLIGNACLF